MVALFSILVLGSLVALVVFGILFVVAAIKKLPKKKQGLGILVSFMLFVVGVVGTVNLYTPQESDIVYYENGIDVDLMTQPMETEDQVESEQIEVISEQSQDQYLSDSEISTVEAQVADEIEIEMNNIEAQEEPAAYETAQVQADYEIEIDTAYVNEMSTIEEDVLYDTSITFDQLARTPDNFVGSNVTFTGRVLQVVSEDAGWVELRLALRNDFEDIIYVYYPSNIVSSRVLDNDIITIYGVSEGLVTYTSVFGTNITLPLIQVHRIEQ